MCIKYLHKEENLLLRNLDERCWTHRQIDHDVFINYRVRSEGAASFNVLSFIIFLLLIYYYVGAIRWIRSADARQARHSKKRGRCTIVCLLGQTMPEFWK